MANFFKNFGKGILYLLVLPFLLVGLAIFAVVGLFVFIILGIKSIILFFTGRSLFDDFPEDKKAKQILQPASVNNSVIDETVNLSSNSEEVTTGEDSLADRSIYLQSEEDNNDPFYVPQYLKSTPQVEEEEETKQTIKDEDLVSEEDIVYANKDDEDETKDVSDNFDI